MHLNRTMLFGVYSFNLSCHVPAGWIIKRFVTGMSVHSFRKKSTLKLQKHEIGFDPTGEIWVAQACK